MPAPGCPGRGSGSADIVSLPAISSCGFGVAADSLGARRAGELMLPIAQKFVPQSLLVTDDQIINAQKLLWQNLRLIAEPGGATALAALISGAYKPYAGERVGVVLCGSNAELSSFPA